MDWVSIYLLGGRQIHSYTDTNWGFILNGFIAQKSRDTFTNYINAFVNVSLNVCAIRSFKVNPYFENETNCKIYHLSIECTLSVYLYFVLSINLLTFFPSYTLKYLYIVTPVTYRVSKRQVCQTQCIYEYLSKFHTKKMSFEQVEFYLSQISLKFQQTRMLNVSFNL